MAQQRFRKTRFAWAKNPGETERIWRLIPGRLYMSPESYVLLLIGCWLLLASTTLWGILRVTRRHYLEYPDAETDLSAQPIEQPDEAAYARFQLLNQTVGAMIVI